MARNVLDLNISNISMDPHTMKWLQNTTQMHDTLTIIDGPGPSPCKTPNSQSDPPCPSHLHSRGMLKCIVGNRTAPPLHSQLPLLTSRERQPSLGAWRRAFSTTSRGDGGEGRMMVARGGWCCLEPRNQWSFGSGFYWWTSLTSRVVSGFAWFALDSKPEGWKIEHAVFDRFCGRNLTMTLRRNLTMTLRRGRWDHKHTSKIDQSSYSSLSTFSCT